MAQGFDPYHRWLGIPREEQPPHHYRLLGIQLFEGQADVIENAADRQMAFLRTFQTGPHGPLSQKLLNQVAAAKICLLNPDKKAAYDALLLERLEGAVPPAAPEVERYDFIEPAGQEAFTAGVPQDALPAAVSPEPFAVPPPLPRKRRDPGLAVMIGILAFGLALVIGLALLRRAADEQPKQYPGLDLKTLRKRVVQAAILIDWPEDLRRGAVLEVNGKRQWVPAAGQIEYPCEPGKVHILLTIPGFKPVPWTVVVEAGQKRVVHVARSLLKPLEPPVKPAALDQSPDEEADDLAEEELWEELLQAATPEPHAILPQTRKEPPPTVPAKAPGGEEPPPSALAKQPEEKTEPLKVPAEETEEPDEPSPAGKPAEPIKLDPQLDPVFADAWGAINRGDMPLAQKKLLQAHKAGRQDPRTAFSLGLFEALADHDWPSAEKYFAMCVKQQPSSVASLNNLALARVRLGKETTALRHWEAALAAGPGPEEIAQNLARVQELVRAGRLLPKPGATKTLDDLLTRAAGGAQVQRPSAFRYMGLQLADGRALDWPAAVGYEDRWCWTCGGRGEVRCPAPDCLRGLVRSTKTEVVGRDSISRRPIVRSTPIRVACRVCGGRGFVPCKFCNQGKEK